VKTILLVVGDTSGDRYAADFVRELRDLRAGLRIRGMGGAELEKAGVELVVHQRELAVGGLFELIPHLHRIIGSWRRMVAELEASSPDLVVLVDSSGFNLPFARRVRRARIPVLYYVAPQVWAWRRGRIRQLATRVDRIAAIFPFEPAVYEGCGVPVEFVGHPLVEYFNDAVLSLDRERIRADLGIAPGERVVALLPGSRRTEIRHCLPVYLETARALHIRDPLVRFVLPLAPSIERGSVVSRVREADLPDRLRLDVIEGQSLEAMTSSDVVVTKPGTATLEATLLDRPLVIAARGNPLSVAILRRLVTVDTLGMPNLIAGERIVPEFLQDDADPDRIASAVLELLAGPARERQLAAFADVRARLGKGGAARRTAEIAEEMIVARGRA
jgi:lipid-A-disaccharide synthase